MAAGSGGRFEASDIRACLATDRFQAWGAVEGEDLLGIILTEVTDYPRARSLRIVGISARRPRRWLSLLYDLEQIARDEFGATFIECLHQPGHERLLTTGGWAQWHVLSVKEL